MVGPPGAVPPRFLQRLKPGQARISRVPGPIASVAIPGPALHETAVVPSGKGKFETITIDSGSLRSVSGHTLRIDETWAGHSYKTVSITVPSGVTVTRDFRPASLSDLKTGEWVSVLQSSNGDRVTAWSAAGTPGPANGKLPAPAAP
jgi:hypothetical protein